MNIVAIYKKFPPKPIALATWTEMERHSGMPLLQIHAHDPHASGDRHHCNGCNTTFSVTVDTIFHHTHLDLQKWFLAISLVLNAKKGISPPARPRHRSQQEHGWYMGMRIRNAMFEQPELMRGIVEMDECYIGGKPRKGTGPHKRGRGTSKTPVVGIIERGGKIVAHPVDKSKLNQKSLAKFVRETVDVNDAMLITDELAATSALRHSCPMLLSIIRSAMPMGRFTPIPSRDSGAS